MRGLFVVSKIWFDIRLLFVSIHAMFISKIVFFFLIENTHAGNISFSLSIFQKENKIRTKDENTTEMLFGKKTKKAFRTDHINCFLSLIVEEISDLAKTKRRTFHQHSHTY